MSIIYDALNKTQQIRQIGVNKKLNPIFPFKWLIVSICLVFSLCILLLLFFLFRQPYVHPVDSTIVKNVIPVDTISPAKSYVLNGVFLSDSQQVAIINHRYYHIGDKIDGMKVVTMNINQVKLKDNNHTLVLSMLH